VLLSLGEEGAAKISALNTCTPCNHGVILELKRSIPTTLKCVHNKSLAALFLGYSGKFDKLKTYISEQSSLMVPPLENIWYEPRCEPPCPELIRSQLFSEEICKNDQYGDLPNSNGETDEGQITAKFKETKGRCV
jgi:hypothetical protein